MLQVIRIRGKYCAEFSTSAIVESILENAQIRLTFAKVIHINRSRWFWNGIISIQNNNNNNNNKGKQEPASITFQENMLHLSFLFESTISVAQSIPIQIEPPELSSPFKLANSATFAENTKIFGIFKAAKRIYSSNTNAINHKSV